ncbi:hypothetical protein STRIP9103_02560 [Streptomyces ipomoeae 91-03]|uniref:Uncharacterized protein n=1 Tax=Streptomyces ipomoeae 91-03 TaxID=698759 RepID=L1KIE0_9ACTN|nr:hypothetical protein STRIP9103_02560 [Streptomyces ipomoeae 91-03]
MSRSASRTQDDHRQRTVGFLGEMVVPPAVGGIDEVSQA